MNTLRIIAWTFVVIYCMIIVLFYTLQTKLIFYPGILSPDYRFKTGATGEEISLRTSDGESISALFFRGPDPAVILYFHGNAGDLSGWQFVAEDFTALGFNFMIIDYRGYGKSTGRISEQGLYLDATAAYAFLLEKGFKPDRIIVYGRSIGSGVAVDLASKNPCRGLVLESPFSSLGKLANEKLPLFFPSLYIKYKFDNLGKINQVKCPVVFLHGSGDILIPPSHSQKLFDAFQGKRRMILVEGGAHNDLHAFKQYESFMAEVLPRFF